MNNLKNQQSKKKRQIFNILTGKTLYEKCVLDESVFKTDLVIKMKFPSGADQQFIDKNKFASLPQFVCDQDKILSEVHQSVYQSLLKQRPTKNLTNFQSKPNINEKEIQIKISNQRNFETKQTPIIKRYKAQIQSGTVEQFFIPCYVKCKSSFLDSFSLNYNTLIYVLQSKCGFATQSFIAYELNENNLRQSYIYILLRQNIKNLLKSADKYKIKKQIDYCQIDFFLNEPTDSTDRPYQHNSITEKLQRTFYQQFKEVQQLKDDNDKIQKGKVRIRRVLQGNQKNALKNQQNHHSSNLNGKKKKIKTYKQNDFIVNQQSTNQNENQQIVGDLIDQVYKRIYRNIKDRTYKINPHIIDEQKIKPKQEKIIQQYMRQLFLSCDKILVPEQQINLTPQQKNYLYEINRNKINAKCEKEYLLKLKRKMMFQTVKNLSKKFNHKTYQTPISYFPFHLPSKRLSFMQRLRGILLYQEHATTPYGDISLFTKMDRIKIAFLSLKQHIRVSNINVIGCEVFALHDNFERFGRIDPYLKFSEKETNESIKGGINGENLYDNWSALMPWSIDYETIRNYFGEETAYQLYLKSHLILFFIVIAPLGIAAEIITRIFIYYQNNFSKYVGRGFSSTHKQQLIFHIVYFAITIALFSFFLQRWSIKEENFHQNFVEDQSQITFRYEYKGPYVRNFVSDSANQYRLTASLKSQLTKLIGLLIILLILAGQCGFFYGMRMAIISLYFIFPLTNIYLISWSHVLCYGIFFIFNFFIYNKVIKKLTQWLTSKQNISTLNLHKQSKHAKDSLFLIGIQLIPIIFLLIFEPFKMTSCYASSCYSEFTQYIYSRYVIVFAQLAIKISLYCAIYIRSVALHRQTEQKQKSSLFNKFEAYIDFIKSQSKKSSYEPSLDDQTEALLHYGLFLTSFPLSPLLGLLDMILEYSIQRIQLIAIKQRPIPKSQAIQRYSQSYKVIIHLSVIVNSWIIFFTLEGLEFSFQRIVLIFNSDTPTYQSILMLKLATIIISIIFFELIILICGYLARSGQQYVLNVRKRIKYQKHLYSKNLNQKKKPSLDTNKIHPFRTVFRTYHRQVVESLKNNHNADTAQQDSEQISTDRLMRSKQV